MLDRQSPKPLHQQLEDILKERIENQEWKPDSNIPSENELSKMYGLSRMTVRSVITRLVHEGLLYRVPGKGTFVSSPKIVSKPLSQMGIREQLEEMGYETETKLLSITIDQAPIKISKKLKIDENSQVYIIKRARYVRNEPLSIHTSYIPISLCPEIQEKNFEEVQLCDILEFDYNLKIRKIEETLESSTATDYEAKILRIKPGSPLLLLQDIVMTEDEEPIEYSKVIFRGDKIKLKLEFSKQQ